MFQRMSHSEVEFAITPTVVDGCRVLVLEGELDAAQAPTLTEALDHGTDGLPVIVDLTALTFLDSSGIHALLRDGEGGKPAALVRAPASNVGRVLDIVDAKKAIPLYDDLPEATRALGTSA